MVPAMLLQIDTEIAYRQAQARADWARSRPAPRPEAARPGAVRELRRRTARLLHVQPLH